MLLEPDKGKIIYIYIKVSQTKDCELFLIAEKLSHYFSQTTLTVIKCFLILHYIKRLLSSWSMLIKI